MTATASNIHDVRRVLAAAFAMDTAYPGTPGLGSATCPPSAGHCAVAAAILQHLHGGDLVSTTVDGVSHWHNRLVVDGVVRDVDVTGDQFGRSPVQIGVPGDLYPQGVVEASEALKPETLARAALLADRAGFRTIAAALEAAYVDDGRALPRCPTAPSSAPASSP
jgi:hypothetical protein